MQILVRFSKLAAAVMVAAVIVCAPAHAAPGPNISSLIAAPSGNVTIPNVPASLVGNTTFTSACILADKYRAFDVFAAIAAAGTLQVQRYADAGCVNPVGAKVPAAPLALASGATCPGATACGDVGSNDGLPLIALKIMLTDTSGSTNAVTALTLTQAAE